MQLPSFLRLLLLGSILIVTASCKHYSTVREERLSYHSPTAAGQVIASTLKDSSNPPLTKIGNYLDAAAASADTLKRNPGDTQARHDYNFAVARIFEIIHDADLKPWETPLSCPGETRRWTLSIPANPKPDRNPANFLVDPADRYEFKGTLITQRTVKDGLGAPLVAKTRDQLDLTKLDRFAQGKHAYYGVTGMISFEGTRCVASFLDPLLTETVSFESHEYPLAADFTAPIAMALAELKPRKYEIKGFFKPDEFATKARLARLQPYDPKKIPLLCIHGLGDSQATWAPLIESLRGDPVIRANYQIWFFGYPTGYPYPLSASILRKQLDAFNARYPDHKKIVVIGHSMGGMISRTLITDSGMHLWNALYDKPPEQIQFSDETRQVMTQSLIFQHRSKISRVIFASPSHRGADLATNFFGRLGSRLIGNPTDLVDDAPDVLAQTKLNSTEEHLKRMPNSIDFLDPKNRFVTALAELPLTPGVPYHTIIGDRGKGGNHDHTKPVSTDGIVPYWSSHLDGAASEIIIPSHHWTNQHPQGIAEIRRILLLHLGKN